MVRGRWSALLLGLLLSACPGWVAAQCFQDVEPQDTYTFDFEVVSEAELVDVELGLYRYCYTVYRRDEGLTEYRAPSHFSLEFGCDTEYGAALIVGQVQFGGETESVCGLKLAGFPNGLAEVTLGEDCRNRGLKIELCDGALVPDGDGVSFPEDPDDPVLTFCFVSIGTPVESVWYVKGGRERVFGGDRLPTGFLTDGGPVVVPGCFPPVATDATSWGRLKARFR